MATGNRKRSKTIQRPFKSATTRTLAANVNSFTTTPGFLIYTTTTHLAHFAPLKTLAAVLKTPEASMPEFETRRVERGSRIVTARLDRAAVRFSRQLGPPSAEGVVVPDRKMDVGWMKSGLSGGRMICAWG